MAFLRAPYWRRTQNRTATVTPPGGSENEEFTLGSFVNAPVAAVGSLYVYYNDKTPSNLTLSEDQSITLGVENGIIGVQWTDRTGGLYHTQILRKSGNTWYMEGQVNPGISKFSVSNLTVTNSYIIGVRSGSTIDAFFSQRTYDSILLIAATP